MRRKKNKTEKNQSSSLMNKIVKLNFYIRKIKIIRKLKDKIIIKRHSSHTKDFSETF